ncbi:HAD family hydrolase [Streptomyces spectabilis]|uniref:FMN phosphatase YigB (HAD superfamily) n=1 Tax=Streptomyces spectabilis TaxID=68270 RepID=A0A5P2XD22_STRST|nr:hypothetical protein [Streptomyces spectabilis]MBB5104301.1 FMN phosphatase YigB (HAD superfamily) [Streptomyces spectabilis]MCI3905340.1 hypothetical protein [Streptomyces spectabilis]QEV62338.1 hypothetical protein CP982_29435 [Streptomyces spectabilis]GGU99079.1 hypothetical protein GCM10010245_01600 [Streptomyces spectabilis]
MDDPKNRPSVVLFDLGNVLFRDPWETLLLTEGEGLADRLGLDRDEVDTVGRRLWRRFSVVEAEEGEYWEELGRELGRKVPPSLVEELEDRLLVANPAAAELLAAASDAGARPVGIASNNTSFWYAKQAERLSLHQWLDPRLVFLSHELGVTKGARGRGLLEAAAERVHPPSTLLIEDRAGNLRRARGLGFRTAAYAFEGAAPSEGRPVADARELLRRLSA